MRNSRAHQPEVNAGVRVTGDSAWLEKRDWKDFCEFEDSNNQFIANQRLTVLCTYRSRLRFLMTSSMWCVHISSRDKPARDLGRY